MQGIQRSVKIDINTQKGRVGKKRKKMKLESEKERDSKKRGRNRRTKW